mmetsp:Transcript_111386/g.311307  ORF Transcript_111386/g.311307 Transcript_111386/m.311307 type:complete len:290 (+) Transcript_111386:3-872(+)
MRHLPKLRGHTRARCARIARRHCSDLRGGDRRVGPPFSIALGRPAAAEAEEAAPSHGRVRVGVLGLAGRRPRIQGHQGAAVDLLWGEPLELVVFAWSESLPHVLEELPKSFVVGAFGEVQAPARLQVDAELVREARAEVAEGHRLLLLADLPVLLLLGLRIQAGPRQHATEEVEEHVADGLEVVATALLHAAVRVDGGVARRAGEAQARADRDVGLLVVALAQSEVDHVQVVDLLLDAPHEVLRLDVPMDHALGVQVLRAAEELFGHQRRCPRCETTLALLHAVLQRLP